MYAVYILYIYIYMILVEFIFHHYDEDHGGTLEIPEAQKIIEDMYGRDFKKFKEPRK